MLSGWSSAPGLWLALLTPGALYYYGVARVHRRARRWSPWRTLSYSGGLLAIAAALVSPIAGHDEDFAVHMAQHLLLGMLAPLLLALSAPMSLALRTLPRSPRRLLLKILHSRELAGLAHPIAATALFVGGLFVLYASPLYAYTLRYPRVHELVHLHFLLSGCLFTWVFVGVDPVPQRGSFSLRVALLLLALASHAALAKLLYAGKMTASSSAGSLAELHLGSQTMFYGGDVIEAALLVIFFGQWYVRSGRALGREQHPANSAISERDLPST
jgi:putative membrane protein